MSPRGYFPPSPAARLGGFSIIELLVAMAVGGIVVLGLIDVLVNSRVSYVREDQFARIQETGRYAMLSASARLRSTRSLNCENLAMHEFRHSLSVDSCALLDIPGDDECNAADLDLTTDHFLTSDRALGYDASEADGNDWLDDLPLAGRDAVAARYLRGDVLVTWGIAGEGGLMVNAIDPVNDDWSITLAAPGDGLREGAMALISDCASTDVFAITGLSNGEKTLEHGTTAKDDTTVVNATDRLSRAYNWDAAGAGADRETTGPVYKAQVFPLRYSAYYICCVDAQQGDIEDTEGGVANCTANPERYRPSLCLWDISAGTESLVLDVADLRVTYTGDLDGDWMPDYFADDVGTVHTAAWVSARNAWAGVSGANVELLVASGEDGVRTQPGSASPAKSSWPPNIGDGGELDADTLGQGLPADRRLYERFVINVALRSRTRWYMSN